MKLSTLYSSSCNEIISEKSLQQKKRKKKEEIGAVKHTQSPFAKAIRATGRSQEKIANKIDVDPSTISRYKSKTRKPSFDTLSKLVKHVGTQPGQMFPELG